MMQRYNKLEVIALQNEDIPPEPETKLIDNPSKYEQVLIEDWKARGCSDQEILEPLRDFS